MMILVNHLARLRGGRRARRCETFALLVSPFAPHLGEELWQRLGHDTQSLAYEPWPTFDAALVKDDVVEIGVQVNGKVRGHGHARRSTPTRPTARAAALADERASARTSTGKTVKKFIYVQGKIVNFIVA